MDKAAIDFTDKFYSNVISGDSVCQAFDKAKAAVEFLYQQREAAMFTIFV